MREVVEIVNGYQTVLESQIFELSAYALSNRDNLDLKKVRMMCENIAREIDRYEETEARALSILKSIKETVYEEEREGQV